MAIMYDFDKTLSPKDMQEFKYFESIGYTNPADFWKEVTEISKANKMDPIATYMYWMLNKSKYIRKEYLTKVGASIDLFAGVETWFKRINQYALSKGIEIEHFIISSGLSEMIEGTSIKDEFKKIYACRYHYNDKGRADWPARIVNYTTKTQYIFRINKGVLDESNDIDLNKATPDTDKYIPYSRMIYIGDGFTDVPCMKVVSQYGGYTIAIYGDDETKTKLAEPLFNDKRANFIAFADYNEDTKLDHIVKSVIDKISIENVIDTLK